MIKAKFEVFVQNSSGNRVSCGKCESQIENYTYYVDVQGLDLKDVTNIQIEFDKTIVEP